MVSISDIYGGKKREMLNNLLSDFSKFSNFEDKMQYIADLLGWKFDPDVWEFTKDVFHPKRDIIPLSYEVIVRAEDKKFVPGEWNKEIEQVIYDTVSLLVIRLLTKIEKDTLEEE